MSDPTVGNYTIGWMCTLQEEYLAACRMLDKEFDGPADIDANDNNTYVFGRIGRHYVVIGCVPEGRYGTESAACAARDMVRSFPNLRFVLMVGIGGGAPTQKNDIRLGDVVVSVPYKRFGGVVQYDLGKKLSNGIFELTGQLNAPPEVLLGVIQEIKRRHNDPRKPDRVAEHLKRMEDMPEYQRPEHDRLYRADYQHKGGSNCEMCGTDGLRQRPERHSRRAVTVHYGTIASANSVMKDAMTRDQYANDPDLNILCFETAAAGLMNNFPCLVIRGICDYSDSHENDDWRNYAALAAAAYTRELLIVLKPRKADVMPSLDVQMKGVAKIVADIRSFTVGTRALMESLNLDSQFRKINDWMAPSDPSTNFLKAQERRYKETGSLFLESEPPKEWESESHQHL